MAVDYVEEIAVGEPGALGPYRDSDYFALPEEPRCELLYGSLVLTPAPSLRHQRTLVALFRLFDDFAARAGGEALFAPLDVRLAPHSVVQPDLLYVSRERSEILKQHVVAAPDLAIEIVSPGSVRRDRSAKFRLYADSGVREYWIVEPVSATIEFLVNEGGKFTVAPAVAGRYRSPVFPALDDQATTSPDSKPSAKLPSRSQTSA